MGRNGWIVVLILVLLLAGIVALFSVQNMARTTQLSLDLGVAAWRLSQPVSIPVLIGACLGTGFAVGAGLFGVSSMAKGREIRRLKQQIAVRDVQGGSDTSW